MAAHPSPLPFDLADAMKYLAERDEWLKRLIDEAHTSMRSNYAEEARCPHRS